MLLNGPGLVLLLILSSMCGLIVYGHFKNCDPITNKDIFARDQVGSSTLVISIIKHS